MITEQEMIEAEHPTNIEKQCDTSEFTKEGDSFECEEGEALMNGKL